MPTPTKGKRFGGSPAHQRLILANLAKSLFEHGSITTTEAKAKRLRPYAETLITKAKTDTVANRRLVAKKISDKSKGREENVLHVLFTEIAPQYATRPGGYTRIIKLPARKGDNAPMALIELVEEKTFDASAPAADPVAEPVVEDVEETPAADEPAESADAPEADEDVTTEGDADGVLDAESPAVEEASDADEADEAENKDAEDK